MTLPRKCTENYLVASNAIITAFHSELAGPPDFLRNQWPAKKWMSPSTNITIIEDQNDHLPFHYAGVDYVAIITPGTYRKGALCVEAATQMNAEAGVATIRAAYDGVITKKFTLSRTGASAFELNIASATGIDKQASIFPTLGYDSSADKTGAAADAGYEGDYEVLSTFGRFEIYASGARQNNKIYYNDGSLRTATITTGEYNLKSLFSEMIFQMNTQSSSTDWNIFTIDTDEEILVNFEKASGATTLSTGTGSILPTLGDFTTALSAATHEALAMALHNYEVINWDLLGARQFDLMAIAGHNLDSGAVITLYGHTSPASAAAFTFSYTFVWDEKLMHKFPDLAHNGGIITAPNYQYYQLEISDPSNEQKYVGIGVAWGGPYVELSHNFEFGADAIRKSNSFKGKTDSRNTIGNLREQEEQLRLPFKNLDDTDFETIRESFKQLDILRPAIWAMLPGDDRWTIYGTYARLDQRFNIQLNRWQYHLEIDEEL
jgi:hypothetical protein